MAYTQGWKAGNRIARPGGGTMTGTEQIDNLEFAAADLEATKAFFADAILGDEDAVPA